MTVGMLLDSRLSHITCQKWYTLNCWFTAIGSLNSSFPRPKYTLFTIVMMGGRCVGNEVELIFNVHPPFKPEQENCQKTF